MPGKLVIPKTLTTKYSVVLRKNLGLGNVKTKKKKKIPASWSGGDTFIPGVDLTRHLQQNIA